MQKYLLFLWFLWSTLLQAQRPDLPTMAGMVATVNNPIPAILSDTCRVQGYTEKFKIHYVIFATTPANASIHGVSTLYRNEVKVALRKAVRTFRNPTYIADGIVFRNPIGDGSLGGSVNGSTENNWIDVYLYNSVNCQTIPDVAQTNTTETYSSCYLVIDNDLSTSLSAPDNVYNAVPHEFFHAIQNAYFRTKMPISWQCQATEAFKEGTAVWAESRLMVSGKEDKGHYQFLDSWLVDDSQINTHTLFSHPNRGIWAYNTTEPSITANKRHVYSTGFLWKYVTERFFDDSSTGELSNSMHNFRPIRLIMENYESNIATGSKTDNTALNDERNAYETYFAGQSSNLSNVLRDFYITILLSKSNATSQSNLKNYPTSGLNFITDISDITPNNLTFKQRCTGRKTDDNNGISFYLTNDLPSQQPIYFKDANGLNFTLNGSTISNGVNQFHNLLQENHHGGLYRLGVNYHETNLSGKTCFAVTARPKSNTSTCTHPNSSNEFNLLLVREGLNTSNNLVQLQITRSNSTIKNVGATLIDNNISECLSDISEINCFSRTTAITYYNKPEFSVMNCPIDYEIQLNLLPTLNTPSGSAYQITCQKYRSGSGIGACNGYITHDKVDVDALYDVIPHKIIILNLWGGIMAGTFVDNERFEECRYITKFQNDNVPSGVYIAVVFNKWGQVINSTKFFKN